MRNVEGVRFVWKPENTHARSDSSYRSRARTLNKHLDAAVGVLSLRRAPKLGKLLVCFASIRSSCDLRPHRIERGSVRRSP